jgi:uncharacterized protein (TIGR02145 family)
MATPIFKFKHPDFINEDFYFIQSTFFGLPQTIPMDLTTFIYYHLMTGRSLNGIFYGWEDLQSRGSTLEEVHFNEWFNENEKTQLYEDASCSDALFVASINETCSIALKDFIGQKRFENESFIDFFHVISCQVAGYFRDIEYYASWNELFEYFYETDNDSENVGNEYLKSDYNDPGIVIRLYENYQFPLSILPHKYRLIDYFKNKFIRFNLGNLLPRIFNDKDLLLDLYKASFPNPLSFHIGDKLAGDRNFIEDALKVNGSAIGNASVSFRNDIDLGVKSLPLGWYYISDELKGKQDIILANINAIDNEYGNEDLDMVLDFLRGFVPRPLKMELIIDCFKDLKMQYWMTKNLDVTRFINGDVILQAQTDEEWVTADKNRQPAWCYYDNDSRHDSSYGKLYNWYAVSDPRGLAPKGFHIPSEREWNIQRKFINADKELKEVFGKDIYDKLSIPENSVFSGLSGGKRSSNGTFSTIGRLGHWWSSMGSNTHAMLSILHDSSEVKLGKSLSPMGLGLSVRCLRD